MLKLFVLDYWSSKKSFDVIYMFADLSAKLIRINYEKIYPLEERIPE